MDFYVNIFANKLTKKKEFKSDKSLVNFNTSSK